MHKSNHMLGLDGASLLRLHQSGVIADAERLRRNLIASLSALSPAALVAIAIEAAPDQTPALALLSLKKKVDESLRVLGANGEELRATFRKERERIAPFVAAATHRVLEIVGAVDSIDSRIRWAEHNQHNKRERLRAAGLSGAELDRTAAPFDPSILQAERAALHAEHDALNRFLRTRDPCHLPASFSDPAQTA